MVSGALVLSVLSGCSSSGGGGGDNQVTQQQIVDKLKNDPRIASAKAQLGNQADKLNKVLDCVAKAMKKDIKQGDLKAYVSGKKTLDDLSGAAKQVTADATTCIKDVVGAS
ncbi:MAG TPA: hypothetical protein VFU35_10325 [Jatrophihabitans sp.]|nr:hypothetical protein [Jatrophihabitans sp.]